jgi:tRNA (pseudouridine54-N1)-methyltransferase
MPVFAIIGHCARTDGAFSLNDMPGGAGRIDILCRAVNASLFLSHSMRRNVETYLVLLGDPDPPRTIMFSGEKVRYLNPDERSAGSLIKKALNLKVSDSFTESTPGVYIRRFGLHRLLEEQQFCLLDENGIDIRTLESLPDAYLLSDHQNLTPEEEQVTADLPRVSIGPISVHADHAITVVLNEIDRRCER